MALYLKIFKELHEIKITKTNLESILRQLKSNIFIDQLSIQSVKIDHEFLMDVYFQKLGVDKKLYK